MPVFIVSHLKCFAKDYCVLNLFVVPELYFLSFHFLHNRAEGLEYTFVCKSVQNVFYLIDWKMNGLDLISMLRTNDFICVDEHYLFFLSVIMVLSLHCIPISILNCPVLLTHLRREIYCMISGSFQI